MKKKVLLCWNYERESWVHQFEKIFNDDEYCFLNFFSKSQEKENFSKAKVYYWEEFNNIDHLLKEINPRIVVFMGLEGPYNLLLNFVCKQRGITTYYLQHGIFHSYEAYKYEERSMRQIDLENKMAILEQTESTAPGKISFLKNSFSFNRISIFTKIVAFLLFKKFSHSVQGSLKFIAGESTQADRYIVYTKYLSKIFIERDKVPDSKFIEIGNHEANEIINRIWKWKVIKVQKVIIIYLLMRHLPVLQNIHCDL